MYMYVHSSFVNESAQKSYVDHLAIVCVCYCHYASVRKRSTVYGSVFVSVCLCRVLQLLNEVQEDL